MTDDIRDDLAAALITALPCEDPEEECDADGRDDHRWCDYCIARAVGVVAADRILAALPARSNPVALRAKNERLRAALRTITAQLAIRYDDQWATGPVYLADLDAARALLGDERQDHGRPFYYECTVPGCTLDGHKR